MYWVWYYCPALSPNWLPAGGPFPWDTAVRRCEIVRPNSPLGRSVVLNENGEVVYPPQS